MRGTAQRRHGRRAGRRLTFLDTTAAGSIRRAGSWTVGELLGAQARRVPDQLAVDDGVNPLTYRALDLRVNRLANCLGSLGVVRGSRLAILSENRNEYIEATFAAAKLGAILCALNWRLARDELAHCVKLVEPVVVLASPRFDAAWRALAIADPVVIALVTDYERRLAMALRTPRDA